MSMWTLIGGNVRMLDEVIMLSWDMKRGLMSKSSPLYVMPLRSTESGIISLTSTMYYKG